MATCATVAIVKKKKKSESDKGLYGFMDRVGITGVQG